MKKRNFASNVILTDTKDNNGDEKRALKKIANLDKKFQHKTYTNVKKHDDLIVHVRENIYGNRKVVQTQFRTLGCTMKKSGSCWNCNYGVADNCLITPNQYVNSFKEILNKISGDVLVLESLGSITDPKEFDPKVFKQIIKLAVEKSQFNNILVETHITKINEDLVKYIHSINNGKKYIGFEVGIEDMNPENRKLINKIGVQNNKLTEVYNMLQQYDMGLEINLIYGFPFMNEQERLNSVTNSIKTISTNFPKADIVLFLMSVKENTIMEYMQKHGFYKPANPWGLVETTKQILLDDNIKNLITFSWFGEKEDPYIHEETCYTCPNCKNHIIDFFRNINGTFNPDERKKILADLFKYAKNSECNCYEQFQSQLKEVDGKNPYIRYKEFIQHINNKSNNCDEHNNSKLENKNCEIEDYGFEYND